MDPLLPSRRPTSSTSITVPGPGPTSGDKLPSQVFREHVQGCFIDDLTGLRNRDAIGIDVIAFECDFPHSDSTWPTAPEVLWKSFQAAELSDEEIDKVTWQNAARWYQLDPFEHRALSECTVDSLRAQAIDVDITPREYGASDHTHRIGQDVSTFLGPEDAVGVLSTSTTD